MHEASFIKQHEEKWKKLENISKSGLFMESDELADLYIDLTNDLAFASTFYPNSTLVSFLNQLSLDLHGRIYKNKKEDPKRILSFFTKEIPWAIRSAHKNLALAAFIFILSMGIGFLSSLNDEGFTNLILGDSYVNMTKENIEQGDPFGVYKDDEQGSMFIRIGSNNIKVAFMAFVVGIAFSFLTGILLFYNGVMVGAFAAFFHKYGLFKMFFLTVFIHGALELSAIVIAGGAGFVIGNSLLFPGTYTRTHSLTTGARSALKIMIALVPVFIVAAFLESYVTGKYQVIPDFLKWLIILSSFLYIIFYFIIFPLQIKTTNDKNTY